MAADVFVGRHQVVELLLRDHHQLRVLVDHHVVVVGRPEQERHLAEEVPRSERPARHAVLSDHPDRARDDDVEPVRGCAVPEDRAALGPVQVRGFADEGEQHALVDGFEARHVTQGCHQAVRYSAFHSRRLRNIVGDSTGGGPWSRFRRSRSASPRSATCTWAARSACPRKRSTTSSRDSSASIRTSSFSPVT